jgi:hypothetical protein
MNDPVTILGIAFRSGHHYWHFKVSTAVLGLTLFLAVLSHFEKRRGNNSFPLTGIALCWGSMYAFLSMEAYRVTQGGTINGPMWSRDCIWFNGLLAIVYLGIAIINRRIPAQARTRART